MKLYNHYKNKPYKYVGEAKHSETLEDVVIYETRYENNLAKMWVRPKKMFFESTEVDGKLTPRFREVPLQLKSSIQVFEPEIKIISTIIEKVL